MRHVAAEHCLHAQVRTNLLRQIASRCVGIEPLRVRPRPRLHQERIYFGIRLASDVRIMTDGGGKVRAALNMIDGVSITRRSFWLTPRANAQVRGGAMTSRCALRPLMVCPVSSWTHAKGQCKLRRSRLRVTSYGRCTWCAIRTNYATWRGRDRRAVPNERGFVDSSCGNARPDRHRAGSPGRISGNWSFYL